MIEDLGEAFDSPEHQLSEEILYGYSTHVSCQELAVDAARTRPQGCNLSEEAETVMRDEVVDSINVHYTMTQGGLKNRVSFDCRVKQDFEQCPREVLQTILDGTYQMRCLLDGHQVYIENEADPENSSGLCMSFREYVVLTIQKDRERNWETLERLSSDLRERPRATDQDLIKMRMASLMRTLNIDDPEAQARWYGEDLSKPKKKGFFSSLMSKKDPQK